jgi:hypothetical protein
MKPAYISRKCDEQRPVCSNCLIYFVGLERCDYDQPNGTGRPTRQRRVVGTSLPSSSSVSPLSFHLGITQRPLYSSDSDASRLLELQLMHHFTESIFSDATPCTSIWMARLPQIAFESDIALNGLLGIAALHYYALKPDCSHLSYAARHYFDRAITKYRSELLHLNADNARALLATSVIITYHTVSNYLWLKISSSGNRILNI